VCYGKGDEAPGFTAGDVHFIVSIQPHTVFTRIGADLFMKKKIPLINALGGFNYKVQLLDGSDLTIQTTPGDIIGHSIHVVIYNSFKNLRG